MKPDTFIKSAASRMDIAADLSPYTILVTRPAHQAADFCMQLQHTGAFVIYYPTINISPARNKSEIEALIERLDELDILIFSSPNAVTHAMAHIHASRRLPAGLQLGAIGPSTAAELEQHGFRADFLPTHSYDSESLLSLPGLADMHGKRVAILRAQKGRSLMGNTLIKRGAQVEYVQVYERDAISRDQAALLMKSIDRNIDFVTITSIEAFRNLVESLNAEALERLASAFFLVGNNKIANFVRNHGYRNLIIARDPTNRSMLRALEQWVGSAGTI